jgi:hypothetical protein
MLQELLSTLTNFFYHTEDPDMLNYRRVIGSLILIPTAITILYLRRQERAQIAERRESILSETVGMSSRSLLFTEVNFARASLNAINSALDVRESVSNRNFPPVC